MHDLKPGKDFVGVGVGVMVRNEKGEFLLGLRTENSRNEPGKWTFPGGGVEFGETIFGCAKREALEEAGIEVEPFRLVKVIDHIIPDEEQHWVNPIVEARIVSGSPCVREPQKMSEWNWFSLENLPENLTLNLAEFFSEIKSGAIKLG
jgi:mutator protein MutT